MIQVLLLGSLEKAGDQSHLERAVSPAEREATLEAGEELLLQYASFDVERTPTSKRRDILRAKYNFECACERCRGGP